MKKLAYLVPIIMIFAFSFIANRLVLSGSISPMALLIGSIVVAALLLLFRPKTGGSKPAADAQLQPVDEFAANAFAEDDKLQSQYAAAMKDYAGNCPKACLRKLEKLAPQCTTDQQTYAISVASAPCYIREGRIEEALMAYNRALVLHPTSSLAHSVGSCQQRMGDLDKAMDSYSFALELDENNLEARSSLATAYVADRNYRTALEHAAMVLKQNENHAAALATSAICYGVLDDSLMCKQFTERAVENGYDRKKINNTISALKK